MKAKIHRCVSLGLEGSTGHTFDPGLVLGGQKIPFVGDQTIKFLGLPIKIPSNPTMARASIKTSLNSILQAVDECPVSRRQKLKLY